MKYQPFTKAQLAQIIFEALDPLGLYSGAALNLLLGTCAQESHMGTYRRQIRGPAVGIFQMEPTTFYWLKGKYRKRFPSIVPVYSDHLEHDDHAAAIFCRLRYLADPKPLPPANDIAALGAYWKRVYNTYLGKGTVEEFLDNWKRFIGAYQ